MTGVGSETGNDFLHVAEELISTKQFQMAVVVADIHLEVQMKAMLEIALNA
jgi:hypothetical protein